MEPTSFWMLGVNSENQDEALFLCNRCRRVYRMDYMICPGCGTRMIGVVADERGIIQPLQAIGLAEDEGRVE